MSDGAGSSSTRLPPPLLASSDGKWRAARPIGILRAQVADRTSASMTLRVDERWGRIFIDQAPSAAACFFGWEVASCSALDLLAARLEQAAVAVTRGSDSLAA